MATNARATGFLELNIAGFEQAIKTAKNLMAAFAAGFTAYKLGGFFKDGINDAITFGKEMASASRVMGGFDAGNILLVQKALEKSGQGAEEARGHISDFLDQGRSLSDLFGGAENYAAALKSSAADYGAQAGVLTRSAKSLQTVWNTMEAVGSKVRTFFMTMTEEFVKPLQAALEYLNEIDLAGVGTAFGKAIADAATILLGLFKDGNIFKVLQLGMTIAFKESVNFLFSGFQYLSAVILPKVGQKFMDALKEAVDWMIRAFGFLFSGGGLIAMVEGFVGVAAKFTQALLSGVNVMVRTLGAGMAYAIQGAVNRIPGLSTLIGGNTEFQNFDDAYNATEGPISQGFLDTLGDAAKELSGSFSEAFDKHMAGGFKAKGEDSGKVFDTGSEKSQLADMIARGFATGQKAIDAVDPAKHAAPKGALGKFQSDPAHAIRRV